MTRFFYYKHPKTGEIFSDQRMMGYETRAYKTSDGEECELVPDYEPPVKNTKNQIGIIDKNAEIFEKDAAYVKECNPKYIKFNDGHRERYDPTKHC